MMWMCFEHFWPGSPLHRIFLIMTALYYSEGLSSENINNILTPVFIKQHAHS